MLYGISDGGVEWCQLRTKSGRRSQVNVASCVSTNYSARLTSPAHISSPPSPGLLLTSFPVSIKLVLYAAIIFLFSSRRISNKAQYLGATQE